MNAIEVTELSKIYNIGRKSEVKALDGLSLKVDEGEIYGLLGPNGAGKTTLIKILLGIVIKTSGDAKILDTDISNTIIKKEVGYLPENHKYPSYLSGEEVLRFFAKLSGYENSDLEDRISSLLDLVGMSKWRKTKIKSYSKGMMQRLGLAQAIINNPKIIFLDEPTDGVDPVGRKQIREILKKLKDEGKTIFINSHLLSEVEMISDRVAILNKGKLIEEGTVEDLTINKTSYIINVESFSSDNLNNLNGSFNYEIKDNHIKLFTEDLTNLNIFLDELRKRELLITSVQPQKNSLEDKFISLINKTEDQK